VFLNTIFTAISSDIQDKPQLFIHICLLGTEGEMRRSINHTCVCHKTQKNKPVIFTMINKVFRLRSTSRGQALQTKTAASILRKMEAKNVSPKWR
jgi:hypothetical protein